ncbi:MAG: hypothetical protein ACYTGH_02685 [Planctomycetota bacterium]|jgi:hypothetical protein
MWSNHPEDADLHRALSSLQLDAGMADRIMAGLPAREASPAAKGLLTINLLEAAAAALLILLGVLSVTEGELLMAVPRLTGGLAALTIGLVLALGADRLSRLDCRVLGRVTGQTVAPSLSDIIIIRAGAALILGFGVITNL